MSRLRPNIHDCTRNGPFNFFCPNALLQNFNQGCEGIIKLCILSYALEDYKSYEFV